MTRYNPRTGLPTEYQTGPFDESHLYLQWGGSLPGSESWSCGVRFRAVTAANSGDPAGMIAGCVSAISSYHADANTKIATLAKLNFVKLNMVNTAGHYAADVTYQTILTPVAGGQSVAAGSPNQMALAVSLTTDVTRGHAHRGRFYLPMPQVALDATTGVLSTTDANAVKTRTLTFITALNAVSGNYKLAVFSRKSGDPRHRDVLSCQVGRTLDTQRRRRKKVLEAWV